MIETTTIRKHTFTSPPRVTTSPNGSVECREVRLHHVRIFDADYDGKGPHRYVEGRFQIQTQYGTGPMFGSWQCGHPNDVAKWERRMNGEQS